MILMKGIRWFYSAVKALDRYNIPLFRLLSSKTKKRIVRKIYRPFTSMLPDVVKLNGLSVCVPRHMDYSYVLQEHEPEAQRLMSSHIRPGMIVVDVGSNIGYLTMVMARLVGPGGKVYAVEPGQDNLDLLRKNIELNGFANVEVLPYAAGSKKRDRIFYLRNAGTLNSLYANSGVAVETARVQEVALDEVIEESRVDFIKLDIEGGEMEALRGMERILQSNPDLKLIVEWNPSALERAGHSATELPEFLTELGFELSVIDEAGKSLQSLEDIRNLMQSESLSDTWYANLFAER